MRGREDAIQRVHKVFEELPTADKYLPVVLATSRGMGKTFFLKKIARSDLEIAQGARLVGRVLTMECDSAMQAFREREMNPGDYFWSALVAHHLLELFHGCRVGKLNFQSKPLLAILEIAKEKTQVTNSLDAWIYETVRLSPAYAFQRLYDLTTRPSVSKTLLFPSSCWTMFTLWQMRLLELHLKHIIAAIPS